MQKWKRSLLGLAGSMMISGGMILNPLLDGMALQAFAMTEKEWNNNRGDANPFDPGDQIKGTIDKSDDDDYYRFVLDEAGEFSVDITSYMKTYTLQLYKGDDRIWEAAKKSLDNGASSRKDSYSFDLDTGTYYLMVSGNDTLGDYTLDTDFDDWDLTEKESNNTRETANAIVLGNTIRGMIGKGDEYDYYKFDVTTDQKVNFTVRSYLGSGIFRIYKYGEDKAVYDSGDIKLDSGKDYKKFTKELDFSKGTYYICFTNSGDKGTYTGRYEIETKSTSSNYTEVENNGSIAAANDIGLPTEIRGRIGEGDEYDYFKFTVPANGNLNVDVKSWLEKYSVRLFDASGSRIWTQDLDRSSGDKYRYDGFNVDMKAGTYYICFTNRDGEYKGDYVINLSMDGQSPTPTTNPTPTNSPTPTTTPAPTPAVNNTFNKSDAMNGVKVIDNSHTLWLGATANGNFTDAVITDASGNIDTSVDNYIANIVTKRDANNNPVEFYSLVFSDGRWDTNYDSRTRGSYVFMGEEYFVAGGVINQSANGLNYTGEANGWRFLAAGKVVKGKGGLVMYQDEWFWIDDAGKCDNNYAAIVRWNGGDFLVHGGRLRTDFTGFSYDPQNKNAWYHIEKGQVWGDGLITDKTIEGSMMTRNVVKGVAQ